MSIINHSTTSCRQPGFPLKGVGTQDSNQHNPTFLPLHGTPVQKPLQQLQSTAITEIDSCLPDVTGFISKKTGSLKNDFTNSFQIRSFFIGPLVQLPEEKATPMKKQEAAMADEKVVLAVSVFSAVELDGRQVDLIARKMKRLTGFSSLRLENTVDSSLIAGFVISYGDDGSHVIDLSVKGQLATLASRIEYFDR